MYVTGKSKSVSTSCVSFTDRVEKKLFSIRYTISLLPMFAKMIKLSYVLGTDSNFKYVILLAEKFFKTFTSFSCIVYISSLKSSKAIMR